MTPEQFTYWLNGYAELCAATPTDAQWRCIKEHLQLVFAKQTPPGPGTLPGVPPGTYHWPPLVPAMPIPYRPSQVPAMPYPTPPEIIC